MRRETRPVAGLVIASVVLAFSSLALIVAAVFSAEGWHLGPLNGGAAAYLAMSGDLLGSSLLAASLWGLATTRGGRVRRWLRRSAMLLVTWAVLSASWRFLLPMTAGTDAETIFYELFTPEDVLPRTAGPSIVNSMLTLWTVASLVFVFAQLALHVATLNERESDPLKRLPVTGWLVAAALSFLGTLLVVFALGTQLVAGQMSATFLPGAFLKTMVAPCLFAGAYAEGAQWGLRHSAGRGRVGARSPKPSVPREAARSGLHERVEREGVVNSPLGPAFEAYESER